MPAAPSLTPELWSLLGFALWPIALVFGVGIWRALQVLTGQKRANEFPSGSPHGSDVYWRLNRAHINTTENLPIFGALVVTAHLAGVHNETTALLAQAALLARIAQSLIHVISGSAMAVNLRFTAYVVQLLCFLGIAWAIVTNVG
jgi:uncharacterized MAPEG superfamily protein